MNINDWFVRRESLVTDEVQAYLWRQLKSGIETPIDYPSLYSFSWCKSYVLEFLIAVDTAAREDFDSRHLGISDFLKIHDVIKELQFCYANYNTLFKRSISDLVEGVRVLKQYTETTLRPIAATDSQNAICDYFSVMFLHTENTLREDIAQGKLPSKSPDLLDWIYGVIKLVINQPDLNVPAAECVVSSFYELAGFYEKQGV